MCGEDFDIDDVDNAVANFERNGAYLRKSDANFKRDNICGFFVVLIFIAFVSVLLAFFIAEPPQNSQIYQAGCLIKDSMITNTTDGPYMLVSVNVIIIIDVYYRDNQQIFTISEKQQSDPNSFTYNIGDIDVCYVIYNKSKIKKVSFNEFPKAKYISGLLYASIALGVLLFVVLCATLVMCLC